MLQRRASRMSVGQNLIHRSNFVRSKKRSSETRKPNWVTENIRLTKQRLKFATCTSVGDIVLVMFYCSATLNPACFVAWARHFTFRRSPANTHYDFYVHLICFDAELEEYINDVMILYHLTTLMIVLLLYSLSQSI